MAAHAAELIEVAAAHGAHGVCLVGSVARGDDTYTSDIDFYVTEFEDPDGFDAGRRADALVAAFRALASEVADVDVRGIPGWLLDEVFEESMRRDCVLLSTLLTSL